MYSKVLSSHSVANSTRGFSGDCLPTTRHIPSHSTSSPLLFNFFTNSKSCGEVELVVLIVRMTAARVRSTGVASSDRYSFNHVSVSSGISSIQIPASVEKYRVVKVIE